MIIKKEVIDDENADESIAREELDIMPSDSEEFDGGGVVSPECSTGPAVHDERLEQNACTNDENVQSKEFGQTGEGLRVPLLECQYCETFYFSVDSFRQHSALHNTRNLETIYNCRQCFRGFCTEEQQHVHERNHSGNKPYKCEVCNEQFSFLRNLEYHIQIHGGVRVYRCQICDKNFLQIHELNTHLKHHATDDIATTHSALPLSSLLANGTVSPWKRGAIENRNASENISDPGNLLQAVEVVTTEERVKREQEDHVTEMGDDYHPDCNDDNNSEGNITDLLPRNIGMSSSAEGNNFTCKRCGLDFKFFRLLQLHKKTRKGVRCPVCSEKFCSSTLLDDHLTAHALEQTDTPNTGIQIASRYCFACNSELKVPTDSNVMNFEGKIYYRCNDCINISMDATVKRELIEDTLSRVYEGHGVFSKDDTDDTTSQEEEPPDVKTEASNDEYQCAHCKVNFGGEFALKTHRRKTVERSCPKCEKPFCNIKLMRRHMRDHERDELPKDLKQNMFPTPMVPQMKKTFNQPSTSYEAGNAFVEHSLLVDNDTEGRKVHEDKFTCPKCCKVVTGKGALAAHMAHAHKEKKTICQHCGKGFAFPKILNMHLAYRMRKSFPLGCRYCPHRYRNQAELENHELYHKRRGVQEKTIKLGVSDVKSLDNDSKETHEIARSDGNIMIIRKKKMRVNEGAVPFILQNDKYFEGLYTEKNGMFYCNQCPNFYKIRNGVKAHIYNAHREKPHTCKYCEMPFPFEKMLEFHLRRRKDLKCEVCNDRFCSYGKLEQHVRTHKLLRNSLMLPKSNDALIKRVMQNSEIEIAVVSEEQKTVVKSEFVNRPKFMSQFLDEEQSVIPRILDQKPRLAGVEQKSAQLAIEQKCPLCDKIMGKRDVLNDHIATHLKRVGEYFRCKDCDSKFLYPIYLVRHYKNRTVTTCETCQKVFCSELTLATHECYGQNTLKRSRTQSMSSEDEIMPKRTSRVNGIEGRLTNTSAGQRESNITNITHDWEGMIHHKKPCKCNFCGKTYGKPGGLGHHLSTMHAVESFPCKACNSVFSSLNGLVRHKNMRCENPIINLRSSTLEVNGSLTNIPEDVSKPMEKTKVNTEETSADIATEMINESVTETTAKAAETTDMPKEVPDTSEKPIEIGHEKKEKCPICGDRFELRCGLSAHIRRKHKDAKPYVCEQCGSAFPYMKALELHKKYHEEAVGITTEPPLKRHRRGRKNALQEKDLSNVELNTSESPSKELAEEQTELVPAETIDMEIDEELTPGFDSSGQTLEEQSLNEKSPQE